MPPTGSTVIHEALLEAVQSQVPADAVRFTPPPQPPTGQGALVGVMEKVQVGALVVLAIVHWPKRTLLAISEYAILK